MKDKKMHDLIERSNRQKKDASWREIDENLQCEEEDGRYNGGGTLAAVRGKKFFVAAAAVIILAAVVAMAVLLFRMPDNAGDDLRFYSESDYEQIITDTTLKEYSGKNGLGMLYFDWYDGTYYCEDMAYALRDSGEVVCYRETIFDNAEGNLVALFVVDGGVALDFLEIMDGACSFTYETAAGCTVRWGGDRLSAYARLKYGGYSYYLRIDGINGGAENILHYAELLTGGNAESAG